MAIVEHSFRNGDGNVTEGHTLVRELRRSATEVTRQMNWNLCAVHAH